MTKFFLLDQHLRKMSAFFWVSVLATGSLHVAKCAVPRACEDASDAKQSFEHEE